MNNWKKVLSCTLATAMVMGMGAMAAGCSKGSGSSNGESISKDDTWFNTKKVKLDPKYNMDDYLMISASEPIIAGDYIVVGYMGEKNFNYKDAMKPDFDYNAILVNELGVFDHEGNLVNKFDLSDKLSGKKGEAAQITDVAKCGDKIAVYYSLADMETQTAKNFQALINIETGDMDEPTEFDIGNEAYIEGIESIGDYVVLKVRTFSGDTSGALVKVNKGDSEVCTSDLMKDLGAEYIYDFGGFYLKDDNTLVGKAYIDEDYFEISIDLASGKATKGDKISSSSGSFFLSENGERYNINEEGIFKDNGADKEADLICGIDQANINASDINSSRIISGDGDKFVLNIDNYSYDAYTKPDVELYILERASENPNAGKKVIKATSINYVTFDQAEGIRVFNETNKDYFVKLDIMSQEDSDVDSDADESAQLQAVNSSKAKLANELAVDLMGGTGPDIIFNASGVQELSNEEYLEDLSKFIDGENGINRADYYTNVIDASLVEGKLYNLPLSFAVQGIATDTNNVPEGQEGFTFEQYKKFVDEVCNGVDPLAADGKTTYFLNCCLPMSDLFFKEGKVNFNQDAFKELAAYVRDEVHEDTSADEKDYSITTDDEGNIRSNYEFDEATKMYLYDIFTYFTSLEAGKDLGLYGLPSVDGRGPSINAVTSVGISAKSENTEGCWEVVKTLLSEDVLATSQTNVINKKAEDKVVDNIFDQYASQYNMLASAGYPDEQLAMLGLVKPDEEAKDKYKNIISSAKIGGTFDSSVANVINEEMQGYFAGQKDIDDVIRTIEDRAQTVIDERK